MTKINNCEVKKKKKNLREALIFLGYFLLGFSEQFRKLEGGRSEY